jgi:hypothetical protein
MRCAKDCCDPLVGDRASLESGVHCRPNGPKDRKRRVPPGQDARADRWTPLGLSLKGLTGLRIPWSRKKDIDSLASKAVFERYMEKARRADLRILLIIKGAPEHRAQAHSLLNRAPPLKM